MSVSLELASGEEAWGENESGLVHVSPLPVKETLELSRGLDLMVSCHPNHFSDLSSPNTAAFELGD